MRAVIEDTRQTLREMPGFAAAVVVMVALCFGVHGAVFYEADGEGLRLVADGGEPINNTTARTEGADLIGRMRSRLECAEKIPGFTVIVGLSHYNVELSVPMQGMRSMFEDARSDVAHAVDVMDLTEAA
jgi:hypothetical protein